jgi:hypothetical protein
MPANGTVLAVKRGTPCRHCHSPATGNPCWGRKPKSGPCDGVLAIQQERAIERFKAAERRSLFGLLPSYGLCLVFACLLAVAWTYPEHTYATLRALWGRVTGLWLV